MALWFFKIFAYLWQGNYHDNFLPNINVICKPKSLDLKCSHENMVRKSDIETDVHCALLRWCNINVYNQKTLS